MSPEELQNQIQILSDKVQELETWRTEKMLQQISYPLDVQSLAPLDKFYPRIHDVPVANVLSKNMGIGNTTIVDALIPTTGNKVYKSVITVGQENFNNQGNKESSKNSQLILENDDDNAALNSFYYGYRKPIYVPATGTTISVTSTGNTMSDSGKNWVVNELAGAHIDIYDNSGALQFTRQIASNTSNQVTIDGTWPATVSGGTYFIFMPIFLGAADYPWRQIYAGGTDVSSGGDGTVRRAIRIGYGSSSGEGNIGIFYGTSTPESVVTANIGSLFLRVDGSTSTTLYVKTTGTGNTGWTPK